MISGLGSDVGERPWVVAVHVRRGDVITLHDGDMAIPHQFTVASLRAVLKAIASVSPRTRPVTIAVFSEGVDINDDQGLQLVNEDGHPISWDIPKELYAGLGLICHQASDMA